MSHPGLITDYLNITCLTKSSSLQDPKKQQIHDVKKQLRNKVSDIYQFGKAHKAIFKALWLQWTTVRAVEKMEKRERKHSVEPSQERLAY